MAGRNPTGRGRGRGRGSVLPGAPSSPEPTPATPARVTSGPQATDSPLRATSTEARYAAAKHHNNDDVAVARATADQERPDAYVNDLGDDTHLPAKIHAAGSSSSSRRSFAPHMTHLPPSGFPPETTPYSSRSCSGCCS